MALSYEAIGHPRDQLVQAIREIVLSAGKGVTESVKWNAPSFATTEHFATFDLRPKSGLQLVLHLGTKAQPHAKVRERIARSPAWLEWKSADRAVATFQDLAQVRKERAVLARILREWIKHVPS